MFTYVREYTGGAGRFVSMGVSHSSLLVRALTLLLVLAGVILMLMLIVPVIVLGVVFAVCFSLYARVRGLFSRAQAPNGVLDGRRNVRVIMPDENQGE